MMASNRPSSKGTNLECQADSVLVPGNSKLNDVASMLSVDVQVLLSCTSYPMSKSSSMALSSCSFGGLYVTDGTLEGLADGV